MQTRQDTYILTDRQAELAHQTIANHCQSLKNWIAAAVERGDHDRAKSLVDDLREHERIFAILNVRAHREIEAIKNRAA